MTGRAGRWKGSTVTSLLGLSAISLAASITLALDVERSGSDAGGSTAPAAPPASLSEQAAEAGQSWIAEALSGSESPGDRTSARPGTAGATEWSDRDRQAQRDEEQLEKADEQRKAEQRKARAEESTGAPSRADAANEEAAAEEERGEGVAGETRVAREPTPPTGKRDAGHGEAGPQDESDPEQRQVQSEIDSLVSEFLATSEAVANRPDGMRPVSFTGSEQRPDWYQALVVTNKENPLLEEECKKEALSISVETLRQAHGIEGEAAALQQAAHHMREHQDFAASHAISYADYLHEIASCRAFCAPLVAHLVRCQVLSVSHSPHGIVLFDLDSDQVDPRYESGLVDEAVATLKEDPRSRVLLVGRASKIGDLRYNRRLSARRALAVRDKLIERGAPADRIKTMWFGWEPPQISSWIASRYGFDSLYAREGGHRMNQSVMLVIYSGSEAAEEKEDETVADSAKDEDVLSTAQISAP